jgi:tRNA-Thr(GGU) m(6)t(6)A37 methyltransferase TsaA
MHDAPFVVRPIGRVESALTDLHDAPKQGEEGAPSAWLAFDGEFAEALRDVRVGDRILVLTWLDRADRTVLVTHPRDDRTAAPLGVFSTRSPSRPNPIGLHRVEVLQVDGTRLLVAPLEAIDGTPVVDVKPVLDATER